MSGESAPPPSEDAARLQGTRERLARIPDPIALLEGLFAHSPVGFQIYTADGHSVLTNQAFRDLFGSEPPPEYNVLQDEIAAAGGVLDHIHRAFAGATVTLPPVWYDARELRQVTVTEGRRVAVTATFFPLFDAQGRVAYVAIAFRDITAELSSREQAERGWAEASAAERRMALLARASLLLTESMDVEAALAQLARLLVPQVADVCTVLLAQADGTLHRAAEAAVDPELERRLRELRPFALPPGIADPLSAAFATGEAQIFDDYAAHARARLGAGHDYTRAVEALAPGAVMIVPMLARGVALGALILGRTAAGRFADADRETAREVAARAGLALDNARLFTEAQQANRAKDAFLAMLGHELRNPLSPIVTALELMRLRDGDALRREREVIERQVHHLQRLVDDLLDVSRIARGAVELRRSVVPVAALVAKALETTRPLVEQRRHHLSLDVPEDLEVDGDPDRLSQVLANLLSNAARYTEPGGRVEVRAWREAAMIAISVRDTGAGIPAELAPTIFDAFVQGRRELARSQGGLGLGLAIARSLVELHGGRMSAHSEGAGRGSEFVVRLPPATTEARAEAPERPPPARAARLAGTRILVVDDNADAGDMLAEALRAAGAETRTALDGAAALGIARSFQPQVALLDLGLPEMDGFELGRRLRAQMGAACPLIIAVTGYGQETDRQRSRSAGFHDHLVKPVEVNVVIDAIERLDGARPR
ncbi:MAG TPA: ATP-binding protein [Vicinamibacteria bacterium]|nr:ATP-binding protein [Vicinamibacteria bacterium]